MRMRGAILAAVVLVVVAASLVPALASNGIYTMGTAFVTRIVVPVNTSLSKLYYLGKLAGDIDVAVKGRGSGYAYLDVDGSTVKVLDLSSNATIDVGRLAGAARIRLDSSALWTGTIVVTVRDEFRIRVQLSPTHVVLRPGGTATITMRIERVSGFDRWLTARVEAPSAIHVSFSPAPPWRSDSTVRVSLRADRNAWGSYRVTISLYAYHQPVVVHPQRPQVPPITGEWSPRFRAAWQLCGRIDILPQPVASLANHVGEAAVREALSSHAWVAILAVAALAAVILVAVAARR